MRLRDYTESDGPAVEQWVKAYDQSWQMTNLPENGFVAYDEWGDVAVGFLVKTDSRFAVLEGFVTNKAAPSEHRHEALEMIRRACEERAKALGFTRILAYLQHDGLLKRAIDSGYRDVCRCAMIAKDL